MPHAKDTTSPDLDLAGQETLSELMRTPSHTYREIGKRLNHVTVAAWFFTITGTAGFPACALLWAIFTPSWIPQWERLLCFVLFGILPLSFLGIGILSFRKQKSLQKKKAEEEVLVHQILQWFQEYYSADAISNGMDEEDLSIEQLYFLRWENISRLLSEQYHHLEGSFFEYMAEKVYQMYFPD